MLAAIDQLAELIGKHIPTQDAVWFNEQTEAMLAAKDVLEELERLSCLCRRRWGAIPLPSSDEDHIDTPSGPLPLRRWSLIDATRLLLLLTLDADWRPVTAFYRQGDEDEKCSVIKGIALLSENKDYIDLAFDAGRTNSLRLFTALALDNPYAAAHYDDPAFNQLVLKALFLGVRIENIIGLEERGNPELSRMCSDYIDERLAAGREIPVDIWLALLPGADPGMIARFLPLLDTAGYEQRYYATRALSRAPDRFTDVIEHRRRHETDPHILALLDTVEKHSSIQD